MVLDNNHTIKYFSTKHTTIGDDDDLNIITYSSCPFRLRTSHCQTFHTSNLTLASIARKYAGT